MQNHGIINDELLNGIVMNDAHSDAAMTALALAHAFTDTLVLWIFMCNLCIKLCVPSPAGYVCYTCPQNGIKHTAASIYYMHTILTAIDGCLVFYSMLWAH